MGPVKTFESSLGNIEYFENAPEYESDVLLVFLHGFPDNATTWTDQWKYFQGRYHLLAPFMPGSVRGERAIGEDVDLVWLVNSVTQLIQQNQFQNKRIFLVGHDIGGFMVRGLARQKSLNIKGLIYISGMGLDQFVKSLFRSSQFFKSYYIFLTLFPPLRFVVRNFLSNLVGNLVYRFGKGRKPLGMRNLFGALAIYPRLFQRAMGFLFKKTEKIFTRSLFIFGNNDAFLRIPRKSEIDKYYDKAEARIVQAGHWPHHSRPLQINQFIDLLILEELGKNSMSLVGREHA